MDYIYIFFFLLNFKRNFFITSWRNESKSKSKNNTSGVYIYKSI